MKISKIKISKFHQFEDFELDLTYPKGHEKEGKPLDKVCFIGQSGTGKTTLLEMIETASVLGYMKNYGNPPFFKNGDLAEITFTKPQATINQIGNSRRILLDNNRANLNLSGSPDMKPTANVMIYFPVGISNLTINDSPDFVEINRLEEPSGTYNIKSGVNSFKLDKDTLLEIWNNYNEKIKDYKTESINKRLKFFDEEKGAEKFHDWKKLNPNPTELVAKDCLDLFLNKFNLAIKTEINDVGEKDILPIKLLQSNEVISYEKLSTGIKQIVYTAFPIYRLLKDDSIILMDEPETSLYPDIQREIIPYYTSFDKNKTSQFFFATHSPIIASAFEPWEIVELKFDDKGKVYRDKYYEGENHVNNYRLDPQILRYDQILTRIFDLPGDSDAKRAEKLQELSILKNKVEKLKKEEMEKPSDETQKIINEYLQLSDDISGTWALTRHEEN